MNLSHLCFLALCLFALPFSASAQQPITLTSPLDYQIFQRETRDRGSIMIRGHLALSAGKVEARILGPSVSPEWHKLALNKATGDFQSTLSSCGFYAIEVRASILQFAGKIQF
jgi:hypothetical protein